MLVNDLVNNLLWSCRYIVVLHGSYGVGSVRRPGRLGEWSVTVNYGLMLTSGAKTKVTTRFLVKNYPYDMFGRYSRYRVVT